MRTIDDLQAAFSTLEQQAPRTIPTPDEASSGRPALALIGGVTGVAAVLAAAVFGSSLLQHSGQQSVVAGSPAASATTTAPVVATTPAPFTASAAAPAVAVGPGLSLTKSVASPASLPSGLTVSSDEVAGDYEVLTIASSTDSDVAVAFIGATDAWKPAAPGDAVSTFVGGQPAKYSTAFDTTGAPKGYAPTASKKVAGLLWTDSAGRTVFLVNYGETPTAKLTQAQLAAIGTALNVGKERALTTPVKFGYLPAGSKLQGTSVFLQKGPANQTAVTLELGSTRIEVGQGTWLKTSDDGAVSKAPQAGAITIHGFTGTYSPQYPMTILSNGTLTVVVSNAAAITATDFKTGPGTGVSLEEITKVINSMTVVPTPGNTASWFDLATALP